MQRYKRWRRSERGQITVLVGTMLVTFLLFFMFVVNVGMLVNAKINLQNAADLAAYAGAATQGRYLNEVGFLNYEMRRNYKKFLFRYHVVGNMAQTKVNGGQQTGGQRVWTPDGDPDHDYGVPAVCVIFNSRDNYCQLQSSPRITGITSIPIFDGIGQALNAALQQLEHIRLQKCVDVASMNKIILTLWLYNTDPDLRDLTQAIAAEADHPEDAAKFATAQGLSLGLGLVPRLQLLLHRIKTLEYYLNFPPQTALTAEAADALRSADGVDPVARERTVQAFFSAINTLGPNTFAPEEGQPDSITMTELLPVAGDRANLAKFKEINVDLDTYYMEPNITGVDPSNIPADASADCVSIPRPMPVKGLSVGVFKDPTILTYYALKLTASAKVLFSPFGRVKMTAYAAALPFGSRVGPKLDPGAFRKNGARPNGAAGALCGADCPGTPNLPVTQGDSSASGWWANDVINEYFRFMREPTTTGNPITSDDMDRAYAAAMVPNPVEKGKYLIPNDLGASETDKYHRALGNPMVRFFALDGPAGTGHSSPSHEMAFWAPIVSPDLHADVAETIKATMAQSFSEANVDPARLEAFVRSLDQYVSRIRAGTVEGRGGDMDESFNVARIRDPLFGPPLQHNAPLESVSLGHGILMRAIPDFETHWNDVKHGELEQRGRIGYSVKIISLQALISKAFTANGSDEWTNALPTDSDAQTAQDLQFIKH